MHIVEQIFDVLGGATSIARGIGSPVQTVHHWTRKAKAGKTRSPDIPPWRRADVLKFARDEGKLTALNTDALAYLQSNDRLKG